MTVDNGQLLEMVGKALEQERSKVDQGLLSKHVGFVDDRFEIFQLVHAFENLRKFHVIDATVIQEDSIDEGVVEELAGLR